MSILEKIYDFGNDILYVLGCPAVGAAITKETVPCVKSVSNF